ncbi:hypothetical protein [Caldimonas sp. KR1-144]|uniref:hypothetical protein n=1 Tax=Caldimonas sp. KR1-144 TaxID=3400911 RepID=UPI003C0375E4
MKTSSALARRALTCGVVLTGLVVLLLGTACTGREPPEPLPAAPDETGEMSPRRVH